MKNSIKQGIYDGYDIRDYHMDRAIGSSTLKAVAMKTPLHALTGVDINAQVADFGSAFHMAILEHERFEDDVICGPEDRRGNKWKDAYEEAQNDGKTLLTRSDYEQCKWARDSVCSNPIVEDLIKKKVAVERSVFWKDEETGLMLKSRPDLEASDNVIVDLKTCLSVKSFDRDAYKYGYHIQAVHYLEGQKEVTKKDYTFLFLAVEKTAPFAFSIYEYDAPSLKESKRRWRLALDVWADCLKNNVFPSYPERQIMSLPSYAMETHTGLYAEA